MERDGIAEFVGRYSRHYSDEIKDDDNDDGQAREWE